jgi:cell shape-determining protein MreC
MQLYQHLINITQKPMETNKTAEEIISITEATVAAYSNDPVWYKQDVEKYMIQFANQQSLLLQKELEETKQKLQEAEGLIKEAVDNRSMYFSNPDLEVKFFAFLTK